MRWKVQALQFLSYTAMASAGLLVPVYAKRELGATDLDIGWIGAATGLAIFAASFLFGRLSDIQGRRLLVRFGLVASVIACLGQLLSYDPLSLGITRGLLGLCAGIYPGALTAYALESRERMGKFSSWGSLGFGIGSLIAGIIAYIHYVWVVSSAMLFVAFLVTSGEWPGRFTSIKGPLFLGRVLRRGFPAYGAVFLRHTGANMIWLIYPLYLLGLGASLESVGVLYLINTGGQFFIMQFIDRYRSDRLVVAGVTLSALTFMSFTFGREWWEQIPSQVMLAASWSMMYVGALKYVNEKNEEHATASGLLNSTLSIGGVFGPLLGGLVAHGFGSLDPMNGYRWCMYVAAGLALAAAGLFLLTRNGPTGA